MNKSLDEIIKEKKGGPKKGKGMRKFKGKGRIPQREGKRRVIEKGRRRIGERRRPRRDRIENRRPKDALRKRRPIKSHSKPVSVKLRVRIDFDKIHIHLADL